MKKLLKDFLEKKELQIDKIMNEYNAYLYKIILKEPAQFPKEDIEEILSDVYVALWKKREELELDLPVQSYLVGILKNRIKNHYRSKKETVPLNLEITSKDEDILEILSKEEKKKLIKNCLRSLKKEEYQIFLMYYAKDYKIKEIAKILNITPSKVKVVLHRVRKKIKKKVKVIE